MSLVGVRCGPSKSRKILRAASFALLSKRRRGKGTKKKRKRKEKKKEWRACCVTLHDSNTRLIIRGVRERRSSSGEQQQQQQQRAFALAHAFIRAGSLKLWFRLHRLKRNPASDNKRWTHLADDDRPCKHGDNDSRTYIAVSLCKTR